MSASIEANPQRGAFSSSRTANTAVVGVHVSLKLNVGHGTEHLTESVDSANALVGPLGVSWEDDTITNHFACVEPNVMRREAIRTEVIYDEINGYSSSCSA